MRERPYVPCASVRVPCCLCLLGTRAARGVYKEWRCESTGIIHFQFARRLAAFAHAVLNVASVDVALVACWRGACLAKKGAGLVLSPSGTPFCTLSFGLEAVAASMLHEVASHSWPLLWD